MKQADLFDQNSDRLDKLFHSAIEDVGGIHITTKLANQKSTWKVISCWQKAVRRGRTEVALRMAHGMATFSKFTRGQLWNRMMICCHEDIGVADIPLLNDLSLVYLRRKHMPESTQILMALYFTKRLASAIKCRSGNSLQAICQFGMSGTTNAVSLIGADPGELEEIYLSTHLPTRMRTLAGWYLMGTHKHNNKFIGDVPGNWNHWVEVSKHIAPPLNDEFYMAAMLIKEPHYIGLPVMVSGLYKSPTLKTLTLSEDAKDDLPDIGPYLSSTLDKHTLEGSIAMKKFVKTCKPVKDAYELGDVVDLSVKEAIGISVFILEGSLVDKRLDFKGRDELLEAWQWSILSWRFSQDAGKQGELLSAIDDNMDYLHECRKEVLKL